MKLLIISYYFPPAGGAGVQRWLKFVKYLGGFGVVPVVYTVKNPKYPITDETLFQEVPRDLRVLKKSIFEPTNVLHFFGKAPQNKMQTAGFLEPQKSCLGKALHYIRANCFIPDAKKFWIAPSVKYLSSFLKTNHVDCIISTGPPHTTHLIAQKLKEKHGVQWLADFRDPWTEIDYFHSLPLSKKSLAKHKRLEKKVLTTADKITVVGKTMQESYAKLNPNTFVLPNGFDFEIQKSKKLDAFFSITYLGSMNYDRNPKLLWKVLRDLCKEDASFKENLKLQLIGKIAPRIIAALQKDFRLTKNLVLINYLPHHRILDYQKNSQMLLVCVNNVPNNRGIITGKIFEYIAAQRPVLAIGPTDGDLAEIIQHTNCGKIVGYNDEESLRTLLQSWYKKFLSGKLHPNSKNLEQYHRKNLTQRLVEILKG